MLFIRMASNVLAQSLEEPAATVSAEVDDALAGLAELYADCYSTLQKRARLEPGKPEPLGEPRAHMLRGSGSSPEPKSASLDRCHSDPQFVERLADAWLLTFDSWIGSLPKGTVIVVDLLTGDFITGSTRLSALDAFETHFGHGKTMGWLHEVGGGIVLGGGLA